MTPTARKSLIAFSIVGSFLAIGVVIGAMSANGVITPQMAGLMVMWLLGMYVGFGVLIATYRLVNQLK